MALPLSGRSRNPGADDASKHLIFLFDGTWNSAATGGFEDITNVFRLNMAINGYDDKYRPQVTFYIPGPGNRGLFDKQLGGAFGQGIDQIIREAYVNLCCNYWPGDKLYFFGFSRGAVAAHALALMIARCGLLKADYIDRLSYVWRYFLSNDSKILQSKLKFVDPNVHPNPTILFLGLYDPVLGRDYNLPDVFAELHFDSHTLSKNVDTGLQLLSIDDNRRRFSPALWRARIPGQLVEQIWMPGVHGDVGGVGDPSFLSVISFLTMIDRLKRHTSLSIDEDYILTQLNLLGSLNHISISDERSSFEMKTLAYKDRLPDFDGINQYVHNIFFLIHNQNIYIRNKIAKYSAERLSSFCKLDASEGKNFEEIVPYAYRSLARTNPPATI